MPKKKRSKSSAGSFSDMLRDTANDILKEVDEAGDVVMKELRTGFDAISERMTNAAQVAQETSKSVGDRVKELDTREALLKLVDEVDDISSVVMDGIDKQLNQLREKLRKQEGSAGAKKKAGRKKAAKKKAAKKKAAKKKAAKKTAKKKVPVRRKKSSVKRKVVRKKSASKN